MPYTAQQVAQAYLNWKNARILTDAEVASCVEYITHELHELASQGRAVPREFDHLMYRWFNWDGHYQPPRNHPSVPDLLLIHDELIKLGYEFIPSKDSTGKDSSLVCVPSLTTS